MISRPPWRPWREQLCRVLRRQNTYGNLYQVLQSFSCRCVLVASPRSTSGVKVNYLGTMDLSWLGGSGRTYRRSGRLGDARNLRRQRLIVCSPNPLLLCPPCLSSPLLLVGALCFTCEKVHAADRAIYAPGLAVRKKRRGKTSLANEDTPVAAVFAVLPACGPSGTSGQRLESWKCDIASGFARKPERCLGARQYRETHRCILAMRGRDGSLIISQGGTATALLECRGCLRQRQR